MYKFREVPKGVKVRYVKLIKPYDGDWKSNFPVDMKVGDITWVSQDRVRNNRLLGNTHIEQNRYRGNFENEYFELLHDLPYEQLVGNTQELNYEIY